MARCEQGYLCEVCGDEVEDIRDSDLYLRYVIGEIPVRELLAAPERHLRCNPTLAQFIRAEGFEPVLVEGPFAREQFDEAERSRMDGLVTRGWQRLQELQTMQIPINEYPLEEIRPAR